MPESMLQCILCLPRASEKSSFANERKGIAIFSFYKKSSTLFLASHTKTEFPLLSQMF